jgi:hypothetical protein
MTWDVSRSTTVGTDIADIIDPLDPTKNTGTAALDPPHLEKCSEFSYTPPN